MFSQGNKIIAVTLGVTAILVALATLVYLERTFSDTKEKPKKMEIVIAPVIEKKIEKIGTATIFPEKPSALSEEKVSVPFIDDSDIFDKYPPDKKLSVADHIRYVLGGRFKKWPPDGFKEWLAENRYSAIPILLKMFANESGFNASANDRWKIMGFLDSWTAPEALDNLYDMALNPSSKADSRQYAILALKNYGEKSVDYLMNIYKGDSLSFGSDDDRRNARATAITSLASIAANPDTKDPAVLDRITSFFKEQYYQQDVQKELVDILTARMDENPRPELLPFFQTVASDPNSQYKDIAKQMEVKLDIMSSPDADNRLVNILNTNYDYDIAPGDSNMYKQLQYWATRELANTSGSVSLNMPVDTRILYLRNAITTESNKPNNVDDQLIRWSMSSILKLGGELTPTEKDILRNLH